MLKEHFFASESQKNGVVWLKRQLSILTISEISDIRYQFWLRSLDLALLLYYIIYYII